MKREREGKGGEFVEKGGRESGCECERENYTRRERERRWRV